MCEPTLVLIWMITYKYLYVYNLWICCVGFFFMLKVIIIYKCQRNTIILFGKLVCFTFKIVYAHIDNNRRTEK